MTKKYEYEMKGFKLIIEDNIASILNRDGYIIYSDKGNDMCNVVANMCDVIMQTHHGCVKYHNPALTEMIHEDGFLSFVLDLQDPVTMKEIREAC